MINVMIHTPVTSRGLIISYIQKRLNDKKIDLGEMIEIKSPHDYESKEHGIDNWLSNCIRDDNMPDIMLSHASDLAVLNDYSDVIKFFEPAFKDIYSKYPVEEKYKTYIDEEYFFYPLFLVCMLMVYNKKKVSPSSLESSWKDLLNPEFKTLITAEFKPPTKTVGTKILKENPELIKYFMSLDKVNSPVAIIKQVQSGKVDLGLSHSSFAITGNIKDIGINYPKEGIATLPQLIMCKKGIDKKIMPIVEILLEEELQKILIKNGFFSLEENINNNEELSKYINVWQGYKNFVEDVKKFEDYVKKHL